MMRLLSVFRNLTPNENDSSVSTEQVYIELNEQMNEINEFKIVYKSTENIVDYFDSNAIREELSKSGNVIFIRLEVNDNFNGLSSSKVHQLSYKCINKSVLLYFESKNDRKCFIFWKSKDIQHFLSFHLVEENFGENAEEFKDFVINFIKDSLRRGHLGLHQHYKNHNKSFNVFLNYFADSRDYNLLLLAAEAGYTQFVNILLDYGLNSASLDNKINAQELALNGQHFDTLLLLLKSNLTYPASFDVTKCPENIKEFYKISLNLHEAVYSKNEEKIVKIIENNPNLCHFYNYSNESAPKIALNCKYIDIYERLLNHKIFLGKHETLNETWENFKNSERIILRKIHFNHSMYMPEKYLHDLTTNSRVAHDDPNVKAKRDLINFHA